MLMAVCEMQKSSYFSSSRFKNRDKTSLRKKKKILPSTIEVKKVQKILTY